MMRVYSKYTHYKQLQVAINIILQRLLYKYTLYSFTTYGACYINVVNKISIRKRR